MHRWTCFNDYDASWKHHDGDVFREFRISTELTEHTKGKNLRRDFRGVDGKQGHGQTGRSSPWRVFSFCPVLPRAPVAFLIVPLRPSVISVFSVELRTSGGGFLR